MSQFTTNEMAEIQKELNPIEKDPRYIKLVKQYKCKKLKLRSNASNSVFVSAD